MAPVTSRFVRVFAYSSAFIFLLNIVLWIYVQWNRSVNGDVAWLSLCAGRLLDGFSISNGCYDTNPPLSIFVYIPPLIFSRLSGLEDYYSIYIYTFLLIIYSIICLNYLLKSCDFLENHERNLFLYGFIASVTVLTSVSFAERDQMIALALVPYCVVQFLISTGIFLPRSIRFLILTLGNLTLLLKPHFVLIPFFACFYRGWIQRRVSVVFDSDFLNLAVLAGLYFLAIIFWYNDFLTIMLPDIISYYLPYTNSHKVYSDFLKALLLFLPLLLLPFSIKIPQKNLQFLLYISFNAFLCLVVYLAQMKGFNYQLLPMYAFLIPALLLAFSYLGRYFIKTDTAHCLFIPSLIIVLFSAIYWRSPLLWNYPSHSDYLNAELTDYIRAECGNPCSYFITHENMEIVSQTAFYTKGTYATRFPSFWFVPGLDLKIGLPENLTKTATYQQQIIQSKLKYGELISEDLKKFRPNLIMILANPSEGSKEPAFDFFQFFSSNEEFVKQSSYYVKINTFTTDRSYYFRGTRYDYTYPLTWNVYKRIDGNQKASGGGK